MRSRHPRSLIGSPLIAVAVSLVIGLVVALMPTAAEAAKPRYVVSTAVSAARADVGTPVRITGTVAGAKAARKKVYLQRRIGSGRWVTVGSTRTSRSRGYAFRHVVGTAGAQSFRVYAPRSSKRTAGVSAARTLTGWRWLYLTQQPTTIQSFGNTSSNWVTTGTFPGPGGRAVPASYRMQINPKNSVGITASQLGCDRFRATISTLPSVHPMRFTSFAADPAQDVTLNGGTNHVLDVGLDRRYPVIDLTFAAPIGYTDVTLGSPRLHCSVNSLPQP